jgi:hypothetical protein
MRVAFAQLSVRACSVPRSRTTRLRCAAGSGSGGDSARERLQRAFSAPAVMPSGEKNVLGGTLQLCCLSPKTGFFRDGFCCTGPEDFGRHVICAQARPVP